MFEKIIFFFGFHLVFCLDLLIHETMGVSLNLERLTRKKVIKYHLFQFVFFLSEL